MLLNKQELNKKRYRKLISEYNKLLDKKWSIASVKLDQPISYGYVRYLQIRPENRIRSDYKEIKKAFELVGYKCVYSKNKDFKRINRKKEVIPELHAYLQYILDPRYRLFARQSKRELYEQAIEECGNHLKLIDCAIACNCCMSKKEKHFIPHYEFKQPWLLEEKTEQRWLTHYRPIDSDIETRLSEIKTTLIIEHVWEKLGGRFRDKDMYEDYVYLKGKIHGYLHGYPIPRIDNIYD